MPRRKNNGSLNNCEFCSSVFDTEWAKIGHLTNEHSDLNAIVTTMQTRDSNQYISEQYWYCQMSIKIENRFTCIPDSDWYRKRREVDRFDSVGDWLCFTIRSTWKSFCQHKMTSAAEAQRWSDGAGDLWLQISLFCHQIGHQNDSFSLLHPNHLCWTGWWRNTVVIFSVVGMIGLVNPDRISHQAISNLDNQTWIIPVTHVHDQREFQPRNLEGVFIPLIQKRLNF